MRMIPLFGFAVTAHRLKSASIMSLRPVVFCGPSGVGKGTLIEKIMKKFPGAFGFSVSHTTRPPRSGEEDGVHYNFTTVDNIKQDIEAGKFIEYAEGAWQITTERGMYKTHA